MQQLNNERENKKYWTKICPGDSSQTQKRHMDEDETEPGPARPKAGEYQPEPWNVLCRGCLYITFSGSSTITEHLLHSFIVLCAQTTRSTAYEFPRNMLHLEHGFVLC